MPTLLIYSQRQLSRSSYLLLLSLSHTFSSPLHLSSKTFRFSSYLLWLAVIKSASFFCELYYTVQLKFRHRIFIIIFFSHSHSLTLTLSLCHSLSLSSSVYLSLCHSLTLSLSHSVSLYIFRTKLHRILCVGMNLQKPSFLWAFYFLLFCVIFLLGIAGYMDKQQEGDIQRAREWDCRECNHRSIDSSYSKPLSNVIKNVRLYKKYKTNKLCNV